MKIGLMGAWNTDSGASIHAELIGREWVKAGHTLTVFSFYRHSFHGTAIVGDDEDYVIRCMTTSTANSPSLDARPFLTADYEVFIVEDLGMLPKRQLAMIFHWIKRKAKTFTVIHDGKLTDGPSFYQFDWDGIVGFDQRYIDFLKKGYPEKLLHLIPYPCYPHLRADKNQAREKLKLPKDRKILFMFGPASRSGVDTIPWITPLKSRYPIHVVVVTKDQEALGKVGKLSRHLPIEVREDTLTISQLYDYLHASDAFILNKTSLPHVTVSSTVFQCLGAGCPIIAKASNFVETLNLELLKYSNEEEFRDNLIDVFEQGTKYRETIENARKYVERNSAKAVAEKFIEMFRSLL